MQPSKVYFTDFRARPGRSILKKFRDLMRQAGIESIPFNNQMAAIKIHFGEPGNVAYIRPNYAAVVVELVKQLGGKPFLTDANTLYNGKRANAVDHLETAMKNGFYPPAMECPVIIADGLKGIDFREIVINQEYCRTAKIASAIADADIVISLNHFKGHDITGFGGALKNLGMGSGSRGGKLEMHSASKPQIIAENCTSCGLCVKNCSQQAITLDEENKAVIDYHLCIGCGQCVALCRFDAARVVWDESAEVATRKISEYALAVIQDKPHFHISFISAVSPNCDCWAYNDAPIVPDLGIAASFDPVALDRACVDLVNQAPALPGCTLHDNEYQPGQDKFTCLYPRTNWKAGLDHAENIGVGKQTYELVTIR